MPTKCIICIRLSLIFFDVSWKIRPIGVIVKNVTTLVGNDSKLLGRATFGSTDDTISPSMTPLVGDNMILDSSLGLHGLSDCETPLDMWGINPRRPFYAAS